MFHSLPCLRATVSATALYHMFMTIYGHYVSTVSERGVPATSVTHCTLEHASFTMLQKGVWQCYAVLADTPAATGGP